MDLKTRPIIRGDSITGKKKIVRRIFLVLNSLFKTRAIPRPITFLNRVVMIAKINVFRITIKYLELVKISIKWDKPTKCISSLTEFQSVKESASPMALGRINSTTYRIKGSRIK